MLTRNNEANKEYAASSPWWKAFVGPLVAAMLAGAGTFVGMQKEMSAINISVSKMSTAMDKIADKQTAFFESFYVPLALKVEQHSNIINALQANDVAMREEMRYLHPSGRYNSGRN